MTEPEGLIRAVIFDFNGVLVDDEDVHFELFREVLASEGVAITDQDYHERYLGYDDRGCFAAALEDAGQAFDGARLDALIARKARRYVQVADAGLRFFPHAAEALAAIAGRWPVAICSGALRSEIEYALDRLDRRGQVAAIIAAEDAHACKPDPAGYLQALHALREHARVPPGSVLEAGACLVIEDSLAGIISARGAGMHAVGISHTYTPAKLREAGAERIIDGLQSLTPAWIDTEFRRTPGAAGAMGILLSRDLIFTSKITGTARAMGQRVLVAGTPSQALAMIAQWQPRVVFVDLSGGDLAAPEALLAYQQQAQPTTAFVAFGSHVDTQALESARAAGCDPVLPRSKFTAELPELITRYLG